MSLWIELDFERVAKETRLSMRTKAACRDVLVEGMPVVRAAETYKMHGPQISRALTQLREIYPQVIGAPLEWASDELTQRVKSIAVGLAKSELGNDIVCKDPREDEVYTGVIQFNVMINSVGFAVQKVGPQVVLHDLSKFDTPPPLERLSIMHRAGADKAQVVPETVRGVSTLDDLDLAATKSHGVGR